MEEPQKQKATIERKAVFKSGKGAFFTASGKKYFCDEPPLFETGDTIEFDVQEDRTLGNDHAVLVKNVRIIKQRNLTDMLVKPQAGVTEPAPDKLTEYREYQMKMMKECYEDANASGCEGVGVDSIAAAFFAQRSSPYYFYLQNQGRK